MSGVYGSGERIGIDRTFILGLFRSQFFYWNPMNRTKIKVNNAVCRVDFDEAWIRSFDDESHDRGPYPNVASVPDSIWKSLIRNIGRALFIEPFAIFPVSYLDDELIVFDFDLLGTRICARKEC